MKTDKNNEKKETIKANILIVDDTQANLRLLVDIFKKKGYKVRPVTNGKMALSGVKGMMPDLILLDIMMPEMDGYEVCRQLKADEATREIPVIFMSALDEVLDKVKAFGVGGVDYITKPFQVEEVLARVETHIELRRLQKRLEDRNEKLSKTVEELKATQSQLVQSEKMAVLGQLIAGVAHEINTPLGVIRSSIGNIANFFSDRLADLPKFLQQLSPELQSYFFNLVNNSAKKSELLSSREQRKFKRALMAELEAKNIENYEAIADTLVDLGVYGNLEAFLPLLTDKNRSQILENAYYLASVRNSSKNIMNATERAAKIVFALKSYARYSSIEEKVPVDIVDGIETVLTLYKNSIKQGVEIVRNYGEMPLVNCYADELNQVWTNIIHNALQAMNNKGTLTIDASVENDKVCIAITDSGPGIPEEIKAKIFEPFFTTKPSGEGSGIGLDIVKKIVEKHSGSIEVDSQPGNTTFRVSIPIR